MTIRIGIDEAGRGPWAGPVFVGLCVLNEEQELFLVNQGITDSKKLSEKKRDALYPLILQNSMYAKVKMLNPADIDKLGIYESTIYLIKELAKDRGLCDLGSLLGERLTVLIDGVFPKLVLFDADGTILEHECIVRGDSKEPAISAASILAKVRRDAYMMKLHEKYPVYQFDKHKGYGTKLHSDMLEKYGPCEEHRKSFAPIKKLLVL
jgi:ribonuclease HII